MLSHCLPTPLLAGLSTLLVALPLNAKVLMIDFGGTSSWNLISTPLVSPYHAATGGGDGDTTWNSVDLTDKAAGALKWSDNTTATSVAYKAYKFNAGATVANGTGWQTIFNGSVSTSVNDGIYASGSVGYDGAMTSANFATDNRAIGVQISGLAIGTYDVYVSGRYNPYVGATPYTLNFYAGTNNSAGFNFSGYTSHSTTFSADNESQTTSWTYDPGAPAISNYVKFTVSITAENAFLNIASQGANGYNGVLSSLQIVSVIPEPSSYALLAGVGGLMLAGLRRRNRAA